MRRHAPSLQRIVVRTLREETPLRPGHKLLLAVSGGSDSMSLLHALWALAPRLGVTVLACGVDHGLRTEAREELEIAWRFCRERQIPFCVSATQVAPGGNLQERAREARYACLRRELERCSADFIVTAHHALDRAETVLLRLLRGAGPEGLSVLEPWAGDVLRPMIRVPKATVDEYLHRHGISSAQDPSNQNPRFLRTRVRSELIPLLQQLSPGIVGHLNALADELGAPLTPVLDEAGAPLRLNRGQRAQLRRALRLRQRNTRILLSGGRVITLEPHTGQPRVEQEGASRSSGTRNASIPAVAFSRHEGAKKPTSD